MTAKKKVQGGNAILKKWVLGLERQEEISMCTTAGSTFHAELRSSDIFRLCIVVLTIGLYMYFADFTFF